MTTTRRLTIATRVVRLVMRCVVAWRYMRRLNYSPRLAWAKAAR